MEKLIQIQQILEKIKIQIIRLIERKGRQIEANHASCKKPG
jgi:hypothetical protein